MSKLKSLFDISDIHIPSDLRNAITRKALTNFILGLIFIVLSVTTFDVFFIVLAIISFCLLNGSTLHLLHAIKKGDVLYISGECIDIHTDFIKKHFTRPYAYILYNERIYKCYLPNKTIRTMKAGYTVTVYATRNNVYEDINGEVNINYPLFCIVNVNNAATSTE